MDTKPQILGPVDTAFLFVERPESPMNIGSLSIFAGKLSFEAFVEHVDARIHQAPLYQKRVVLPPLNLGQPSWVYDPDFHIKNHIFRLQLNRPGTDDQLRELAGKLISSTLDRSKPLWEIYVIEGLSNDRTALFFKIHHAMVDGLAAIELFTVLFDLTDTTTPAPRKPLYDPPDMPSDLELLQQSIVGDLKYKVGVLGRLGEGLSFFGSVLGDREKRRSLLRGMVNLVSDNLTPIKPLAINGKNSGRMTVAWAEFPLAEVRAIRSAARVSVNDVMLSVLGGAVAEYEHEYGHRLQPFFRVLVPVNMRVENEKGSFGNRISVLPIDVPLKVSDPMERLRYVGEYTQVMKQSSLSNGLDMLLTLPSLYPAVIQPAIWSAAPLAFAFLAHSWCTNVSGPQIPIYLMGHEMLHSYGYFPLNPSMGMCCVIMSYNQKITMTLVADSAIIPDVQEVRAMLERSYATLRTAAKVNPIEPITVERVEIQSDPSTPSPRTAPPTEDVILPPPAAAVPVEAPPPPNEAPPRVVDAAISAPVEETVTVAEPQPAPPTAAPDNETKAAIEPQITLPTPDAPRAEMAIPVEPQVATPPETDEAQTYLNGKALPAAEAVAELAVEVVPAVEPLVLTPIPAETPRVNGYTNGSGPARHRLFSEDWAQAFQQSINNSKAYKNASLNWKAGSLAFVMQSSPKNGFVEAAAVLMDLYRGDCRSAHALPLEEVKAKATFIIEGSYGAWMRVLRGEAPPLVMLVRGDLHLKKGSLVKLLPFTQSAQELLHSAQRVPWE
ncbi:MAG: wax ester/triacylglycerol synthase family O-acyltransferase [Anaerolineae bacterium]|nr:wax ester/triacylglycerol synthase family O-acyltransferase [Anaerolineae bacterium]